MSISHELSEALIAAEMPQEDLSSLSGVARSTLWYLSAKKHVGSADTADKIAAALGMKWKLVPINEDAA